MPLGNISWFGWDLRYRLAIKHGNRTSPTVGEFPFKCPFSSGISQAAMSGRRVCWANDLTFQTARNFAATPFLGPYGSDHLWAKRKAAITRSLGLGKSLACFADQLKIVREKHQHSRNMDTEWRRFSLVFGHGRSRVTQVSHSAVCGAQCNGASALASLTTRTMAVSQQTWAVSVVNSAAPAKIARLPGIRSWQNGWSILSWKDQTLLGGFSPFILGDNDPRCGWKWSPSSTKIIPTSSCLSAALKFSGRWSWHIHSFGQKVCHQFGGLTSDLVKSQNGPLIPRVWCLNPQKLLLLFPVLPTKPFL